MSTALPLYRKRAPLTLLTVGMPLPGCAVLVVGAAAGAPAGAGVDALGELDIGDEAKIRTTLDRILDRL